MILCSSNELQCRSSPCSDLLSHAPHTHTHSARGTHVATHISGRGRHLAMLAVGERKVYDLDSSFFVRTGVLVYTRSRTYSITVVLCPLWAHAPHNPTTHMRMRAEARAAVRRRSRGNRAECSRESAAPRRPRPHPAPHPAPGPPPTATRAREGARAPRGLWLAPYLTPRILNTRHAERETPLFGLADHRAFGCGASCTVWCTPGSDGSS